MQGLRADGACDFLLNDAVFASWYHAADTKLLVLLGDVGHGKTVVMSFLADELCRLRKRQLPQPKICHYYCRDGETGKAIYIFSALILSLLHQLPGLNKLFFKWYKQAQASGVLDPASDVFRLEKFLRALLGEIDRPLFLLIDGLDECDAESLSHVFRLIKDLPQKFSGLKIIVSCRPREDILEELGKNTPRIQLRADPQRDAVIVEKTVEQGLHYLAANVKTLVADTISRKAQGSAIWTKLTVELIKASKIRAFGPMQRFLLEMQLPNRLSALYRTLLARCTSDNPENHRLAIVALGTLATSHRHLSILELAWATGMGATDVVNTVHDLAKMVDHERILNILYPFLARLDYDDLKKHQVGLVHQSVKEFALKDLFPGQSCVPGLAVAENNTLPSAHVLEAFMLNICVRYLLLGEIELQGVFSEEQAAIAQLPQASDLFSEKAGSVDYTTNCTWKVWEQDDCMIHYDPAERGFGELFVYASCFWSKHFGSITSEECLPNLADIENLCKAGSRRLDNWTRQNCRPGCTMIPRFEFDSRLYDPLAMTFSVRAGSHAPEDA